MWVAGAGSRRSPQGLSPRAWGLRPSASDPSHAMSAPVEVHENPGQVLITPAKKKLK